MEAEFTEDEMNAFDGLEPEPELSPINACGVTAEPEQNNLTLYNGDCLEQLKKVQDKSVDLIYLDLPYASSFGKCVDCAWDKPIDLEALWKELKRVRKDKTPIFFCCNAKFGYDLIGSNKKEFRYDLIWVKSAPCGFLNARKMPMKKHELIYVFYKNLPFYDLSSHKHKFVKTKPYVDKDNVYGSVIHPTGQKKAFDPPLPVSVVKEENSNKNSELYGKIKDNGYYKQRKNGESTAYDPPLPVSVVSYEGDKTKEELCYGMQGDHIKERKKGESRYNPPLPTSVVKDCYNQKERLKSGKLKIMKNEYDPVLPTSVVDDEELPNSLLEIKSQKGKHATQKPTALTDWLLKYFSKEGDIVLDPTMGSGGCGVSCKKANRKFIGIEMNPEIFQVAVDRINNEN